ncbi:DUF7230 family protein [Paradevosia shaoguanensis]|uniref:Uncharacterized protein n=1 Tax=Paradevosia shaoguanensis TaxID=1335043 RepID=A0AA41QIX1_9HYPH|nr:hypothetical protein [Paradevosia shaoguanensis]KFL27138.1 hypothetical protein JP74_09560 [Devosia sp. 17-2-E-8]QMV03326.1 hypothetical protein GHV40_18365 [Devosia sp. D6-9]CDP50112.1 hypothetical protein [Devosia sp. DBB001]MCF1741278.1 hypothetical protein [Paradevosia shaoguanensis]MCI0125761.1 hypothetical protein [Paradevosia shaoguanensis]
MKIKLTRKQSAPPNLAARALSEGQFRPKVEKNPKAYSRKQKHPKGSVMEHQLPFSVPAGEDEQDNS